MKYKHGLYFDYPEDLHAHMISPKQVRDVALDGKFPYYNKGFWFRVLQVLVQIVMIETITIMTIAQNIISLFFILYSLCFIDSQILL